MNKKILTALTLFCFAGINLDAQLKYWVKFKDKNGTPYSLTNPSAFLTAESIQRRAMYNTPYDASDLPVTPSYIAQVDNIQDVTVLYASKWLNGVVVSIPNAGILNTIGALPFVLNSSQVNKYKLEIPKIKAFDPQDQTALRAATAQSTSSAYNYGGSSNQNMQLNVDCLHDLGFRGLGITIAVMDVGFHNVDQIPLFDTVRAYNNFKGTRDFVNGGTNVYNSGDHGTAVLSCMAANLPGVIIGSAPLAAYWLLRTEDENSEKIVEEYNWIRGAEFADSVGARILTTSLGYTKFDNNLPATSPAILDGRTAPMSIAATMAARKGMFVVNAAGNEGDKAWHFIGVPADADSICTVGAVSSMSVVANFSSVGPTADGRIKPDLVAQGVSTWVSNAAGQCVAGDGTSFAAPVLAGAIACFMKSHVDYSSMLVLDTLKHTASRASNPNNSIGWGIPNMCAFPVGIFEQKVDLGNFSVYPNPFNNLISIDLNKVNYNVNSVVITDVLGKIILTEFPKNAGSKLSLSIGDLPRGVYFVRLNTSAGTMTKKIIKHE